MTQKIAFTEAAIRRAIRAAEKSGYRVGGVKPDGTVLDTDGNVIEVREYDHDYTMRYCHCTPEQFAAFTKEGLLPKPRRGAWDKRELDAALKQLDVRSAGYTNNEVYFIQTGQFIKIGFSAYPLSRMDSFRTGTPYDMDLLGSFPGDVRAEERVQAIFKYLHHRDEWFRKSNGLLAYIEWIKGRGK